ncbi:MAG TPA: lycopene cyclase family protein [Chitinophagaceae bacterium]|nr:lycopene cyclase family protein [Chitinophagaceae bacterium]
MIKSSPNKYHYIFTGAGCAGLSLLMHLLDSGKFADKKILLIDKSPKDSNDRTWCFWETGTSLFESIVYKRWNEAWYHSDRFSRLLELSPYQYKMIRGIDFYDYCLGIIRQHSNIEILHATVDNIYYDETSVTAGGRHYDAEYIFNSILFEKPVLAKKEFYLQQHFKGWMIETQEPVFNPAQACLMDFRVSQQHGTTFAYVLPVSENKAMVEYTLFTRQLLDSYQYDEGLQEYINLFVPGDYAIMEEESGVIPMTNHVFSPGKGNVVNIGSAGGQTKPSSGYTFYFIQQHSKAIAGALMHTGKPFVQAMHRKRFRYYDSVLLNVLATAKLPGKKVFDALFKKNRPSDVLRFLNNESAFKTDLAIIASLPTSPFLKAGIQQMLS